MTHAGYISICFDQILEPNPSHLISRLPAPNVCLLSGFASVFLASGKKLPMPRENFSQEMAAWFGLCK
jgi:hypothetical protein